MRSGPIKQLCAHEHSSYAAQAYRSRVEKYIYVNALSFMRFRSAFTNSSRRVI